MKHETMKSHDGYEITLYLWDEVAAPKGVVQLVHGMNEHLGRYDDFAKYLNASGFIVVGDDHRAHGLTAKTRDNVGKKPNDGDLFIQTVGDVVEITKLIEARYSLPIVVLGHSYGSFLTEYYMLHEKFPDSVRAFILTGAAKQNAFMIKMGHLFSLGAPHKPAKAIAALTFDSYDKRYRAGKNAWITRDQEIVDRYNADEFIVDVFSKGFYRCFFRNMAKIFKHVEVDMANELPLLIACGADDGVGGYGKYATALAQKFRSLGFARTELQLYEGCRHEILNETNRAEVYADIAAFLSKAIS